MMARRSGAIRIGYRAVKRALSEGSCRMVLIASDAGDSLRRMETGSLLPLVVGARASLGELLGRNEVAIIGICDAHLVAGIVKRLDAE